MHPVGFDRLGRPVLYSCLQLAANRSVEDNRRHMIATFEQVSERHIFGLFAPLQGARALIPCLKS